MTDPSHYDVSYAINPWMRPDAWRDDPEANRRHARDAFEALQNALRRAGAEIVLIDGVEGLPDMVFPANAAVVFDGRAIVARFRFPERQGESAHFRAAFESLRQRGLLAEVADFPDGIHQEGAGDCIWDRTRGHFWVGHGQRSTHDSVAALADFFGRPMISLELVNDRFYHLDTCFCVLPRGQILYYPPAFSPDGLSAIRAQVPAADLIEASDEDAARFCVNAVALGDNVVMAEPAPDLIERLAAHGYQVHGVPLAPFILSGGGAYCMTLRLDLTTVPQPRPA
jgi:N-dimethylarginine dimethylaminohydrolase